MGRRSGVEGAGRVELQTTGRLCLVWVFTGNSPYLRLCIRHAASLDSTCLILIVELGCLLLLFCDAGRLGSISPGAL